MPTRGRIFSPPASDRWSVDVQAHPDQIDHWHWVIRLNGKHIISGGCYRSVRHARLMAAGSLRVRQAIHYGQTHQEAEQ